jgi:hypothetical protein
VPGQLLEVTRPASGVSVCGPIGVPGYFRHVPGGTDSQKIPGRAWEALAGALVIVVMLVIVRKECENRIYETPRKSLSVFYIRCRMRERSGIDRFGLKA